MNLIWFSVLAVIMLVPAMVLAQDVQLPKPQLDGRCSVEKALLTRRSVRAMRNEPMSLATLSQLAWAAQGMTQKSDPPPGWSWGAWQGGWRTAPSAGAMYPIELYIVAGSVDGLTTGVYKYKPLTHGLVKIGDGDRRGAVAAAALGQAWMEKAPVVFVVGAAYKRTAAKYGERAPRYVHIEVGHVVENICLQAVALDLGSTMVGAFKDPAVKQVLEMPGEEDPLAIVPVGKPE